MGNGFDLAHGLPTSYENFHQWLLGNNDVWFIKAFEKLYPAINIDGRWCDIESALKKLSLKEAMDFDKNYQDCPDDVREENSSHDAYICGENLRNVIGAIPSCLLDWALTICKTKCSKLFDLEPEAYYLTFNYTRTLEDIYGIYSNDIYHIHGIIGSGSELVMGYDEDSFDTEIDASEWEDDVNIRKIVNTLRRNKKPVNTILKYPLSSKFLREISEVSDVIVYGHSCSNVDKPYYNAIANNIKPNAKWTVYVHNVHNMDNNTSVEQFIKSILQPSQTVKITNNSPLKKQENELDLQKM